MILIVIICGILFFCLLLLLITYMRYDHSKVAQRMHNYIAGNDGQSDFARARNRETWQEQFMYIVHILSGYFTKLRRTQNLDKKMQQAGLPLLGSEFIIITGIISAAAALVTALMTLHWYMAVAAATAAAVICQVYLNLKITKRRQAFTNQLGDTLSMIADAMRSGFSFMQSIELAAREMKPPIGEEFAKMLAETRMGIPTEQALQSMADRVASRDFDLIMAAVLIQRQVGGDLSYILDNISSTVVSRIKMKREIKTLTSQGRMSGSILLALPFAMAAILSFMNPAYLQPLITKPVGHMAVGGAIVLEIIGYIVIQRIVDIDV
ncbi:type II secretion system F family protein [Pectinatus sottacetonis]|uniref:type II secretion system F family protein n=1 Tax=Pectinatus sottacetonis TaxID=1002795 RepID=UPI0018C64D99|nr:type II secretion system F family protein [Pectinatus sottacetonis]